MNKQILKTEKKGIDKLVSLGLMVMALILMSSYNCFAQVNWTSVNTDVQGDVTAGGTDGKELFYYYDDAADSIWFRVDIFSTSNPSGNFGVNVMINIPGGGSTFNFWGNAPNNNPFHKLVTTWVTGSAPSNYSGTIGIANATGVNTNNFTNLHNNNIDITYNAGASAHTIILGMRRADLITDAEMGGNSITVQIAAATGLSTAWQDDIYSPTGTMTFSKSTIGIEEENTFDMTVYPNPTNGIFNLESSALQGENTIEIHNQLGQLIYSSVFHSAQTNAVDITSTPAGIYLLSIKNKNGVVVYNGKIIKE